MLFNDARARLRSFPKGSVPLFFIQLASTLSFSVLYSTLVLYMKGKIGMEASDANSIVGVFVAFNFALHLLGGFWGGNLLSNRLLFCVGMLAQTIGCVLLSFGGIDFLYYGLAAFLTGSGLNVTCINCMLTQRFAPDDTRRETAFLWNYAGMNIGFFIGYSLSGIFQLNQQYQELFLLSSLGNILALLLCCYHWKKLADIGTNYAAKKKNNQRKGMLLGFALVALMSVVLSQTLHYANFSNQLVLITGLAMLVWIVYLAWQQPTKEARNKMLAFAALMVVSTIFWMLYQIGPMGLTLFIDNNVQREYADWIIPPQWFQNINTLSIVVGGPLLGIVMNRMRMAGININIPAQFALALLLIGLAFVILPVGISNANADGLVNPGWIVASFILQSAGELLISPIGYAMIGSLAPSSLQGVMMGMWMLNTGVGATLSSYSSNLMIVGQETTSPLVTNSGYGQVFLLLGLFAIVAAGVLFLVSPRLRQLIQQQSTAKDETSAEVIQIRAAVFE